MSMTVVWETPDARLGTARRMRLSLLFFAFVFEHLLTEFVENLLDVAE